MTLDFKCRNGQYGGVAHLELCGGKIELKATAKGLVARSALHRDVLIRAAKPDGSGGRIP
jgi:hypothetical protein